MSDAYLSWYRTRTTRAGFDTLTRAFAEAGISLEHPVGGSAILLDVDGGQVPLPAATVAELVGSAVGTLNVEWWFSPDVDLTCCFSYEPFGWEKQTYYLDGLTADQVRVVERVLFAQMLSRPSETVALIVDETGRTADADWDALVNGDTSDIGPMPDALVLATSIADQVRGAAGEFPGNAAAPGLSILTDGNWAVPGT
ncbi:MULTISPECIES: hypothetical protein [unclassified Streptomyces]|uniref:hypothetical protein n=1 Tax=unclassified Streptomyces TaxID=2593676 RepID=UPI001F049750|nr:MULTISPECIES: hypothetical protein [unclassified Streptomyces]MCH0561679.1 hypothetical protein [Streptomyces sp. MUM 2J]MCH0568964.1 hypothetical protein [Streptomyces sp. MUM 136J]